MNKIAREQCKIGSCCVSFVSAMAPVVPATGYCSTCGAAHPSNHRFCGACGQPLRPAVSSGPAYPQLEAPMQAEA